MQMYVQCALDVWTVVDIYGMWIIGPRLCWGFCGLYGVSILSTVTVLYIWCKRWLLLMCSGPLSVLPGNSNTLLGWGHVNRMSIVASALRLVCWHRCSFSLLSWPPQD